MMETINVKLAELKLAEDNVRMHPKRQIEEYKRSLQKFGQTKNAVIDEDKNVLIGNGLVMAAIELGWEEITAIMRTDLSENDKLKLMLGDNKIYGLGIDNLDVIEGIFQRLQGDLDIPGYEEGILKSMVAEADVVTEEIIQYGRLSADEINSIKDRQTAAPTPISQSPGKQSPENLPEASFAPSHQNDSQVLNDHAMEDNVLIKCPKCGEELCLSRDALRQLLS